jgi:hypothetical protein
MLTRTITCCINVVGICHYVGKMVRYIERGVRVLGSQVEYGLVQNKYSYFIWQQAKGSRIKRKSAFSLHR